jgi:hypothetical protein
MTEPARREWSTELKRWIYPGYPTEPGQPNATVLEMAFWEALKRCVVDENSPVMVALQDGTEPGLVFDRRIPAELWEHMAVAIAELRAAGLGEPTP